MTVIRKIFWPRRNEAKGNCRKLQNSQLRACTPHENIVNVILALHCTDVLIRNHSSARGGSETLAPLPEKARAICFSYSVVWPQKGWTRQVKLVWLSFGVDRIGCRCPLLPTAPSHGCGWKEWITPTTKWFMSSHPPPENPAPLVTLFKGFPTHTFFNPLKTKQILLYLKTQSVPRCKHFSSWL